LQQAAFTVERLSWQGKCDWYTEDWYSHSLW